MGQDSQGEAAIFGGILDRSEADGAAAAGGEAATACGFGSKIAAKCGRSFPNLTDRRPRHDGRCWPEVPQSSDFTGNWQRHSSHYDMNS